MMVYFVRRFRVCMWHLKLVLSISRVVFHCFSSRLAGSVFVRVLETALCVIVAAGFFLPSLACIGRPFDKFV